MDCSPLDCARTFVFALFDLAALLGLGHPVLAKLARGCFTACFMMPDQSIMLSAQPLEALAEMLQQFGLRPARSDDR
jgi:hypothetical protein